MASRAVNTLGNLDMRANELKAEIDKLQTAEKLALIEEVWNEIARSNEAVPLQEWQKKELDQRLSEYEQGKVQKRDYQEVHDALKARYE